MSKKIFAGLCIFALIMGLSSISMADDGVAKAAGLWTFFGLAIAVGFAIGVAALGTGLGMGYAISHAVQGVARNPEAGGRIFTMLIMGLGFIESIIIYALLIGFLFWLKMPDFGILMDAIIKSFG